MTLKESSADTVFPKVSVNDACTDFEPGASASESICWWDDSGFVEHLWKFFQIRRSEAMVTFGSEPVANPDRKVLANSLWKKVTERFIPVS